MGIDDIGAYISSERRIDFKAFCEGYSTVIKKADIVQQIEATLHIDNGSPKTDAKFTINPSDAVWDIKSNRADLQLARTPQKPTAVAVELGTTSFESSKFADLYDEMQRKVKELSASFEEGLK
ncbi:hypothetical protein ACFLZN_02380, partial [Nanoarchaeota archaeon]